MTQHQNEESGGHGREPTYQDKGSQQATGKKMQILNNLFLIINTHTSMHTHT